MGKTDFDIFSNLKIYPNASQIFQTALAPLQDIKNDCLFILDTNALILPYSTGSQSLTEISKIYSKLKKARKLFVPAQVAREFARNRPIKLQEIFQQVSRKRNSLPVIAIGSYPLLEDLAEYKESLKLEKEIKIILDKYKELLGQVVNKVKNWTWNDPVSLLYREIFTPDLIIEPTIDEEEIKLDLTYRSLHKIPPGYKDSSKPDDGIGDLLIWRSILEMGKEKKHIVFVSGDEKADWFYNSENQALYPRFELLSEFQQISDNKSFHIIRLSTLLTILNANQAVIHEIAEEEVLSTPVQKNLWNLAAEKTVFDWFKNRYSEGCVYYDTFGFPDIEVKLDEGSLLAVEVFVIFDDSKTSIDSLRRSITRTFQRLNTSVYLKLTIAVISVTLNNSLEDLKSRVAQLIYSENVAAVDVDVIYGYLGDKENFIISK
jgi:rRNA-processing protein FCF1